MQIKINVWLTVVGNKRAVAGEIGDNFLRILKKKNNKK